MSDAYRLVFSGEVIEGQHPAVVRKRLAAVLKLADDKMDVLFSGKAVVVKKAADESTAARYQQAFQKAGARLRVLPAEGDEAMPAPAAAPQSPAAETSAQTSDAAAPASADSDGLSVLPVGTPVLEEDERAQVAAVDIDTSHISVQGTVFDTGDGLDEADAVEAPNVDHLTIAELGTELGFAERMEVVVAEVDANFDLAALGALMAEPGEAAEPPPGAAAADFDVAEPGADLDQQKKDTPPAAPDTGHLKLVDDDES